MNRADKIEEMARFLLDTVNRHRMDKRVPFNLAVEGMLSALSLPKEPTTVEDVAIKRAGPLFRCCECPDEDCAKDPREVRIGDCDVWCIHCWEEEHDEPFTSLPTVAEALRSDPTPVEQALEAFMGSARAFFMAHQPGHTDRDEQHNRWRLAQRDFRALLAAENDAQQAEAGEERRQR